MALMVIGKEYINYISKKTGNPVKGYKLYMTEKRESVEGLACVDEFVSEELGQYVKINHTIELFYNKFGQVVSCSSTEEF